METVKVSHEGHILLPKTLRDAFHLMPGVELAITVVGSEIHLKPTLPPITPTTVAAGRGLLASQGRKALTDLEIKQRLGARLKAQDAATQSPK